MSLIDVGMMTVFRINQQREELERMEGQLITLYIYDFGGNEGVVLTKTVYRVIKAHKNFVLLQNPVGYLECYSYFDILKYKNRPEPNKSRESVNDNG